MLTQFTYTTGRVYDGEQVLEITLKVTEKDDDLGFATVDATFVDKSRHITGLVKDLLIFGNDTPQAVGRAVLGAYDRCNYQTL